MNCNAEVAQRFRGSNTIDLQKTRLRKKVKGMKKPGDRKHRPPGGGAAGRAHQFELERETDSKSSATEDDENSTVHPKDGPKKKGTKKRKRSPKSK
jgi:hypothetical protein